jgi:dihydropteroate synthase
LHRPCITFASAITVPSAITCASAAALDTAGPTAHTKIMIAAPHPGEIASSGGTPLDLAQLVAERRPVIMGVLNVTPDSFSDGGRFLDPGAAIAHAKAMIDEGAHIIDIGAESSRPYGNPVAVTADEERRRLEIVLPAVARLGRPVSIDTTKASVAAWALQNGAAMVNDVWGLQRDPDMAGVAAAHGGPVIIMHNRDAADPDIDIFADLDAFFARSLAIAAAAGIRRDAIVLDPGVGFGKTPEQSLAVIARLDRLERFGLPILVGASRKRFIHWVAPAPPERRLGGSIAAHILAVENGASLIRTHDVAETVQAMRIVAAIRSRA